MPVPRSTQLAALVLSWSCVLGALCSQSLPTATSAAHPRVPRLEELLPFAPGATWTYREPGAGPAGITRAGVERFDPRSMAAWNALLATQPELSLRTNTLDAQQAHDLTRAVAALIAAQRGAASIRSVSPEVPNHFEASAGTGHADANRRFQAEAANGADLQIVVRLKLERGALIALDVQVNE